MKIKDITDVIETFAPLAWQEDFDNSGLLVGNLNDEVNSALLCVDITEQVMQQAVELGVDMVIAHHPVIFTPLRRITGSTGTERIVARALREGIALYGCHTNLDAAPGGLSFRLADAFGLTDQRLLSPTKDASVGFGVIGTLPHGEETLALLRRIGLILGLPVIRHSRVIYDTVSRVAVCSGSGSSQIGAAVDAGAELLLAADFKYNNFIEHSDRTIIADIGHFESEYCAIDLLFDIIRKKIPTFALHKCSAGSNPVNYLPIY